MSGGVGGPVSEPMRIYHGGAPGLHKGDLITPRPAGDTRHLIDGCPTCEARRAGAPTPDDDLDPTAVYVTTDRDYARIYAAGYPRGGLYRVEVDGPLTPSPDPVPSWAVSSARVVGVIDALVRLTPTQTRRALRRAMSGRRTMPTGR